jgi:cobalt-zinc-cadmium efflux system outer membrane protein
MPSSIGADRAGRVRNRLAIAALAALLAIPGAAAAQSLSLEGALARAAAQDLNRPASQARVSAAEATARQAGVKPNPRLGADLENFAGTGPRKFVESTETTLYYEQTLERGGKREARVGAARAEVSVARLKGEVRALDVLATVQALWVEAAAADAAVEVAQERLAVAENLGRETARRVAAARDPLYSGERARTAILQARIALDQARDEARNAREALAAYLGLTTAEIEADALSSVEVEAPAGEAPQTADLALLEAQRDAATAQVRVEQSRAVQDPTFRAGVRHFGEGGDVAFVVGGSIPLGRNDTNKGNIERARAERLAAESELALARAERDREIARLKARRATAATEVRRIDAEVLPSARRAVALARDGHARGGGAFTYTEVAESQGALIGARARRVELLKSFHLDGARLDRLTARHATLIASAENR